MDKQTQQLDLPWQNLTTLFDFLDELREADYQISLEQYGNVQDLLIALAARGETLDDPQKIKNYIGPLLCRSPLEQEDFQDRFDHWIKRKTPLDFSVGKGLSEQSKDQSKLRQRRIRIILLLLSAIITGVAYYSWLNPLALLVLAIIFLPDLLLFLTEFYQEHWLLIRRTSSSQPQIQEVNVSTITEQLFSTIALAGIARKFRRRVEAPYTELNISATIKELVHNAGWFKPIYKNRTTTPEYLILVDRTGYRDHQVKFFNELIKGLLKNEVTLNVYYFDGDLRVCFPSNPQYSPSTISEIVAQYQHCCLIIFADPRCFFQQESGEIQTWIEQLHVYTARVLMTPEAPAFWSYYEKKLEEHFVLLPATIEGLDRLIPAITNRQTAPSNWSNQERELIPTILEARPQRWIQRNPPNLDQINEMIPALYQYLGPDGYYWLAACAVYPVLDWNLTLFLGHSLRNESGDKLLTCDLLFNMARLPWFRHGYMPDWIRIRFIEMLRETQEQSIRDALEVLRLTAIPKASNHFSLEIATQGDSIFIKLKNFVSQHLSHKEHQKQDAQDYIFLNFMLGRKRKILSIQAPKTLRAIILQQSVKKIVEPFNIIIQIVQAENGLYFIFKRLFDFIIALVTLIIFLPVMFFVAVLIRLDSPGPIIFAQERVGARRRITNGRTHWERTRFACYKFRTMRVHADQELHRKFIEAYIKNDSESIATFIPDKKTGTVYKMWGDVRVTHVGAILRKTSIDELPQLWNIIRGDMSFVGPRPAIPYEVENYSSREMRRLEAIPGLTGLSQIKQYDSSDFTDIIRLDIEYVENQSFKLDLKIWASTIPAVLKLKIKDH